jgi:hypothetical protein
MSKTLRRPMFRGGPVNSYNTGITSGLGEPGYADGGRVGAKVGGFFNFSKPGGSVLFTNPFSNVGKLLPTSSYTGGIPQGGLTGLTQAYQSLIPSLPKTGNLIRGGAIPLSIAAAPFYMTKDPLREKPEEEQLQTTAEELQKEYFGQPRRKLMEDIMSGTRSEAKSPYEGFDYGAARRKAQQAEARYTGADKLGSTEEDLAFATGMGEQKMKPTAGRITTDDNEIDIEDVLNEKKIQREADLYARLLGGEEAKQQALYDALLAASPAFFKGKNLREAAPEVLKAVSESKAFEKPQNIKQAAAQLAIQRRIAIETAKAKGEDQLTRLERSLASKETIGSKLKGYGIEPKDYQGATTADANLDTLIANKAYSIGNDLYLAVPSQQMIKDPVTGQQRLRVARLAKLS